MTTSTIVPLGSEAVAASARGQTASSSQPLKVARPLVDIEVVIPVYNERADVARSIGRLADFLSRDFPYSWVITIADNASTDGTWDIARALTRQLPGVGAMHLNEKGRGRALKRTWLASRATVAVYMDVDLSTSLTALAPLVAPLLSGHADVAIGSRLAHSSQVERGAKREFISRSYNALLKAGLRAHFSDAQCGFKAIRTDIGRELLPLIEDDNWFFDTELLVLAERAGLRIHEVPVDWVDDPNSSVDVVATAKEDLRGMMRVRRELRRGLPGLDQIREHFGRLGNTSSKIVGQLIRFAIVGVLSTLLYVALYYLARTGLGPQWSNVVALGLSAIANTAMNRGFTFGIGGRQGFWRHQAQGLMVFLLALLITSGSLALLAVAWPAAPLWFETGLLCLANLIATVLRFTLLRSWVFAPAGSPTEKKA